MAFGRRGKEREMQEQYETDQEIIDTDQEMIDTESQESAGDTYEHTDIMELDEISAAIPKGKKKKKKKKRKKWIILGIVVLLIVLGAGACQILGTKGSQAVSVETMTAKKENLSSTLSTSGIIGSTNTKSYYSPVNATINGCNAKEGSAVNAGTLIISFDTTTLEQDNQKAQLTASATVNGNQDIVSKSNEAAVQKANAQNEASYCQAQIDADNQYITDLNNAINTRMDEITAYNASQTNPENQVDPASDETVAYYQSEIEKTQSEIATLEGEKSTAEASVDAADAGIMTKAATAQVSDNNNLAELEAATTEQLLEKGKAGIKTEFNGVITKMVVANGTAVQQGSELFTIASLQDAMVEVNLTKANFAQVQVGQTATIDFNGHSYTGTVTEVSKAVSSGVSADSNTTATASSAADAKGSNIKATVKIDNPDDALCLGLDAKVQINTAEKENVLVVPKNAVSLSADGTFCYLIKDGVAAKQKIKTGISSDKMIEITEGIKEGDQIITKLPDGVTEGMPVEASAAKEK